MINIKIKTSASAGDDSAKPGHISGWKQNGLGALKKTDWPFPKN